MATGQALERARPQEQALIQVATELGVVRYAEGGGMMIDLTNPKLRDKYNVLAPAATIAKSDPNFTPSLSIICLNPDYENGGDFYPMDTSGSGQNRVVKTLALTKRALDQIAQKAGIEDLGPEIVYFGDRDQNVRITWHARIRNQDGWTYRLLFGSQEWIEEAEMAQLKASPPEWAQKSDSAYNEWWAKNWWGRVHKFRVRMTETKARLAAYRQALTVKQKYLPSEIGKPFLVATLTYTPDTSDPTVLRMLMTGGAQAETALFGPAPEQAALPAGDEPIEVHAAEEEGLPGFDRATGEIVEPERPKPAKDPVLPTGIHEGKHLSEVARIDPDYTRESLLKSASPKWGIGAEEWLAYWEGAEDASTTF